MTIEFNMEIAVRNIIACRRRAKPQDVAAGIAWYAEAYEECRLIAWQHNLPVYAVVGVVAAFGVRFHSNIFWPIPIRVKFGVGRYSDPIDA